jgi:hypothetical protein
LAVTPTEGLVTQPIFGFIAMKFRGPTSRSSLFHQINDLIEGGFMENQREIGVIHNWRDSWGLVRITFKQRFFFHISEWDSDLEPVIGQQVSFEIRPARPGGALPQAVDVRPEPLVKIVTFIQPESAPAEGGAL